MILCKRSVETLEAGAIPAEVRHAADRIVVIGDFSWCAVATQRSAPVAMAVARSRAGALRRLERKIGDRRASPAAVPAPTPRLP